MMPKARGYYIYIMSSSLCLLLLAIFLITVVLVQPIIFGYNLTVYRQQLTLPRSKMYGITTSIRCSRIVYTIDVAVVYSLTPVYRCVALLRRSSLWCRSVKCIIYSTAHKFDV